MTPTRFCTTVKLVVEFDVPEGATPSERADEMADIIAYAAQVSLHDGAHRGVAMVAHSSHGCVYPGPAPYAKAHLEPRG